MDNRERESNSYIGEQYDNCTNCLTETHISNIHLPSGECGVCRKASHSLKITKEQIKKAKELYKQTMREFKL